MGKIKDSKGFLGTEEVSSGMPFWRALLAEFMGTLVLVFVGTGSCISYSTSASGTTASSFTQIALCFGISIATMAQTIGHVSGCHINPAVSLAMLAARQISVVRALFYVIVQCIGGVVGSALLLSVVPEDNQGSLGMTSVNEHMGVGQAFGVEFLITFVLVITIFGATDERRDDIKGSAPLAIGLAATACHLFAIPATGASMNPARSFGPAVVMGLWQDQWVYWAGPILGGILAGLVYSYIFRAEKAEQSPSNDIPLKTTDLA